MKKLISKFKNWLIKKLGGHTNDEVTVLLRQSPLIRNYNFQPIILRTEIKLTPPTTMITITEDIRNKFLSELAGQLCKELLERNLVLVNCMDDIPSCARTYRAELAVISPDDLRNAKWQMENE